MTTSFKLITAIAAGLMLSTFGLCGSPAAGSADTLSFVSAQRAASALTLASSGRSAPLVISSEDWPGVIRAYKDLQADIGRVTGVTPKVIFDKPPRKKEIVIAGTIGKSTVIENLISRGKINVDDISGKWECFLIQTVTNPLPGVKKALVIAGSDKRGTIYGIYEVSRQIGVSPWHWWAGVPVKKSAELYVLPGRRIYGEPSVKYRGIFLNDEYPALTRWVEHTYGTVPPSVNPPIPFRHSQLRQ